ncbi:unnamed protein product [Boreogadus saida]
MSSPVPRATLASWEQVPNCWLGSPNHGAHQPHTVFPHGHSLPHGLTVCLTSASETLHAGNTVKTEHRTQNRSTAL